MEIQDALRNGFVHNSPSPIISPCYLWVLALMPRLRSSPIPAPFLGEAALAIKIASARGLSSSCSTVPGPTLQHVLR
ncbi:hypothetical protein GOP47_0003631 [Adiantum capillus-veneris]|uniref:Uncharacterized protein n=1 Tax=Adiantum capillus-veneris TaxID=13818 RepID=A0A9D4V776_ADICA|nr:hypothetical protein GOP47_0003631 [Adiantum capillus-veneris]